MENPWASPWAATDVDDSAGSSTTTGVNPEPPPPAFFSSTTPNNLNTSTTHSPWDEDTSFGDWASSEPASNVASGSWGIWGLGDGAPGADGQLTPRDERKRKGSSPQWPSSRSASPGLRPPPLSKRSSADHLALDPWASELSFNMRDEPDMQIQLPPSLPTTLGNGSPRKELRARASNISINIEPHSPTILTTTDPADARPSIEAESKAPSLQVDSTVSPPTSVSDAEGIQGAGHDDSPITPEEDIPGGTVSEAERKASKVQKLVTLYDGIARKSSFTPEIVPGPKRSVSREPPSTKDTPDRPPLARPAAGSDESLSIKKTREAPQEDEGPPLVEDLQAEVIDEVPNSPSLAAQALEDTSILAQDPAPTIEETDIPSPDAPAQLEYEPFEVDLGKIDEMFPGPASQITGDDVTVPDYIITDSFENISERKAWYRISRFGPMRQHNAGDNENYVRISWASSSIRSEIIQTVRRWMEEDSMGRRPFHAGPGKRAGGPAFGWNQPSTPVNLEDFFKRGRSGQATPEQQPRRSFNGPPVAAPSVPSDGEQRPLSLPVAPQSVDTNAWNGLAMFGRATPTSPQHHESSRDQDTGAPLSAPIKLQDPPKKSMAPPALPTGSTSIVDDLEDGDDDWGEMVTPSAPEFPSKQMPFDWATPDGPSDVDRQASFSSAVPVDPVVPEARHVAFAEPDHTLSSPPMETVGWASSRGLDENSSAENQRYSSDSQDSESITQSPASPPPVMETTRTEHGLGIPEADSALTIIQRLPDLSYMLR